MITTRRLRYIIMLETMNLHGVKRSEERCFVFVIDKIVNFKDF